MVTLKDVLISLRPGVKFTLDLETNSIKWLDEVIVPSDTEVSAELTRLTKLENKSAKVLTIESELEKALESGVTWNTKVWHTDHEFQGYLGDFILAYVAGILPPDYKVLIRTKNNENVYLGFDELKSLAVAVIQYAQGVFIKSWEAKDKL